MHAGKLYLAQLEKAVGALELQIGSILEASRLVVNAATAGGSFYIYDPRNIISVEVTSRAGGLAMARILHVWDVEPRRLSAKDAVLVFLCPEDFEAQRRVLGVLRKAGCKIVAVFPRSSNGRTFSVLEEQCEVVIDNGLETCGGVVSVEGWSEKLGPSQTVINSTIAICICAEVVNELLARGRKPSVNTSGRIINGQRVGMEARTRFEKQGY